MLLYISPVMKACWRTRTCTGALAGREQQQALFPHPCGVSGNRRLRTACAAGHPTITA